MIWSESKGCIIVGIIGLILTVGLLFPTIECGPENPLKVQGKNDELQLVNANKAFDTEYGRYPKTAAECVSADGQLMSILKGTDHQENPRKIVFIEVPNARKKDGIWKNGLHPQTRAFLDPWGNPFLVKLDTDYDGIIFNPYTDSAASEQKLKTPIIVWSAGKDGIFGNPKSPGKFQGSDDVISWQ